MTGTIELVSGDDSQLGAIATPDSVVMSPGQLVAAALATKEDKVVAIYDRGAKRVAIYAASPTGIANRIDLTPAEPTKRVSAFGSAVVGTGSGLSEPVAAAIASQVPKHSASSLVNAIDAAAAAAENNDGYLIVDQVTGKVTAVDAHTPTGDALATFEITPTVGGPTPNPFE